MVENEHPRALVVLSGLGLGVLVGAGLGYALGPAGARFRGRLMPLLAAAAEHPEVRRLLEAAAQRAGLER
jgi:hypothetical protein